MKLKTKYLIHLIVPNIQENYGIISTRHLIFFLFISVYVSMEGRMLEKVLFLREKY